MIGLTGETRILKNEYGYSTTIGRKLQDGKRENMYMAVQLPKGHELDNGTLIVISKGFLTFYKDRTGLPKVKIVIVEYMVVHTDDNDLPF